MKALRSGLPCMLLLTGSLCGAAAVAQPHDQEQGTGRADVQGLIAALDAPELKARLEASRALREQSGLSLLQIEELIRKSTLSPEQHRRLVNIAWQRFKGEPKAAMGVRTSFVAQRGGVILDSATPGFHAAEVLRRGDRLESADGYRLDDFGSLRLVILSREPGYEMPVVVIRDGTVLNVKVRLAEYERLGAAPVDERTLGESFRLYRAREYYDHVGDEAVLESGVPMEVWNEASLLESEAEMSGIGRGLDTESDAADVIPGGQARGGVQQPNGLIGGRQVFRNVDGQRGGGNRQLAAEIQFLQQIRQERAIELQTTRLLLSDQNLTERRKRELRDQIARLESEILTYDMQIRQRSVQLRGR